jgi:ABC-2 type transport system ATP-binding protein
VSERGLQLQGVTFEYRAGLPVLRDVNVRVGPGLTLVIGPNGGGKSTLLKVAAGVERPDTGIARIDGRDLWRDEVAARRTLAYVPEDPDVTPFASVLEVLQLVAYLRGESGASAAEALAAAGLQGLGGRSVRQLSKGQRKRVLLAAAWVGSPGTLLLDEPLDALDAALRPRIVEWVEGHRSAGAAVVLVTHELEPFSRQADRALVVRGGRVTPVPELPAEPADRLALLSRLAAGELTS